MHATSHYSDICMSIEATNLKNALYGESDRVWKKNTRVFFRCPSYEEQQNEG